MNTTYEVKIFSENFMERTILLFQNLTRYTHTHTHTHTYTQHTYLKIIFFCTIKIIMQDVQA